MTTKKRKEMIQELVENGYDRFVLNEIQNDDLALLVQETRTDNYWTNVARIKARLALSAKKRQKQTDMGEAARFFKPEPGMKMVHVSELVPGAEIKKSTKHITRGYMEQAERGEIEKRGPLHVHKRKDGKYTVVDGNATHVVGIEKGLTHFPVRVVGKPLSQKEIHAALIKYAPSQGATKEHVEEFMKVPDHEGGVYTTDAVHKDFRNYLAHMRNKS